MAGQAENIRTHGVVRWKHSTHLRRLLPPGAATSRDSRMARRVEAHRERLLAVKRVELPWADLPWTEVNTWHKGLHRDCERALAETKLPERPDYETANGCLPKH